MPQVKDKTCLTRAFPIPLRLSPLHSYLRHHAKLRRNLLQSSPIENNHNYINNCTYTMDIDDILASVDRTAGPTPESAALDHQLLTRFWVAERAVPELLPWPGPLMDRMMGRVSRHVCQPRVKYYGVLLTGG